MLGEIIALALPIAGVVAAIWLLAWVERGWREMCAAKPAANFVGEGRVAGGAATDFATHQTEGPSNEPLGAVK